MFHTVEVDDEVMSALKAEAEPFVDTPNSVLRRKFGLQDGGGSPAEARGLSNSQGREEARSVRQADRSRRTRVPSGQLLPESEYQLPILKVLESNGGRAATREVVAAVGEMVESKLRPLDREETARGGLRWESRVQFARLDLVRHGLLEAESPRGVWELSDRGREHLKQELASA